MEQFCYSCRLKPPRGAPCVGHWSDSCNKARGKSLLRARGFWRQKIQKQSLRHWITSACPLPEYFWPYRLKWKTLQTTVCSLQVFEGLLQSAGDHSVTQKESHQGLQTAVCRTPLLALQEPEVLWIMCLPCYLLSFPAPLPGSSGMSLVHMAMWVVPPLWRRTNLLCSICPHCTAELILLWAAWHKFTGLHKNTSERSILFYLEPNHMYTNTGVQQTKHSKKTTQFQPDVKQTLCEHAQEHRPVHWQQLSCLRTYLHFSEPSQP